MKKTFTTKARLAELERKLGNTSITDQPASQETHGEVKAAKDAIVNKALNAEAKPFSAPGIITDCSSSSSNGIKDRPASAKPKSKPATKAKKPNNPKLEQTDPSEAAPAAANPKIIEQTPPANKPKKPRLPVQRPKPKAADSDLRSVEISQLRIRFQPTGFAQKVNSDDGSVHLQCTMPIVDPDFPFDLPSVRLQIVLPAGYPGTVEAPVRPVFTVLNSDIPSSITSKIDFNMKWGVSSLPGGSLMCRPMLKYLEEHLERWLVDSGRDIKFVSSSAITVSASDKKRSEDSSSDSDTRCGLLDEESKNPPSKPSKLSLAVSANRPKAASENCSAAAESTSRIQRGDWLIRAPVVDQSDVGGLSYSLSCHLSVCRGIDLVCSQKLTILVSCDRCRFAFPVEDLRPFVDRIEHCPKCTNLTKFYYKMQLITPGGDDFEGGEAGGFDGFFGVVRMVRAKPVDLLPSLMQTACSRCYGHEEEFAAAPVDGTDSQLNSYCKVEEVKIGEMIAFNCLSCHQRIRYCLDRVSWSSEEASASAKPKSKAKAAANSPCQPTLSVGTPLPQNGACSHYKKSFRWYRFPCCGMAFPCDECHKADPIAKNHPVEWATRFICGFCSREQAISVKECPECGRDTSAAGRRKTAFWEGGKGARNQILMSRKDSKKYKDYSRNSNSAVKKREEKKK